MMILSGWFSIPMRGSAPAGPRYKGGAAGATPPTHIKKGA
jgi:hypothetical protein